MNKKSTNFGTVFCFDFLNRIKAKSFRAVFTAVCVLFFAVMLLLPVFGALGQNNFEDNGVDTELLNNVYVVDNLGDETVDWRQIGSDSVVWNHLSYTVTNSRENANELIGDSTDSVIINAERNDNGVHISIVFPENCAVNKSTRTAFAETVNAGLNILFNTKNLNPNIAENATVSPIISEHHTLYGGEKAAAGGTDAVKKSVNSPSRQIICLVFVITVYFIILTDGKRFSNSVLSAKSSNIAEGFINYVNPRLTATAELLSLTLFSFLKTVVCALSAAVGYFVGSGVAFGILKHYGNDTAALTESLKFAVSLFSPLKILMFAVCFAIGLSAFCSLSLICASLSENRRRLAVNFLPFALLLNAGLIAAILCIAKPLKAVRFLNFVPFFQVFTAPNSLLISDAFPKPTVSALLVSAFISLLLFCFATKCHSVLVMYKGKMSNRKKIKEVFKRIKLIKKQTGI